MDNYKHEIIKLVDEYNNDAKLRALTDIWENFTYQEECYKQNPIDTVKPSWELALDIVSNKINMLKEKNNEQ